MYYMPASLHSCWGIIKEKTEELGVLVDLRLGVRTAQLGAPWWKNRSIAAFLPNVHSA